MGSIYRHNEGGAPLAVAECAHKLGGFRTALVDGIREKKIVSLWRIGHECLVCLRIVLMVGFCLIVDVSGLALPDWLFGR